MSRHAAVVSWVAVFVGFMTSLFFLLSACQTANPRAAALSACLTRTCVHFAVQSQNSVRPFCQNHIHGANFSSDLRPFNLDSSFCGEEKAAF